MEIDILNEKGNGLLGRNVSIVLNLAKKELNKGNDRNFYDILVAMVEEIKPYIQKEYPSDSDSDSPNTWHTGTPTEEGWYVCKMKGTDLYETQYFTGVNWNEEIIEAWQKIEPYRCK